MKRHQLNNTSAYAWLPCIAAAVCGWRGALGCAKRVFWIGLALLHVEIACASLGAMMENDGGSRTIYGFAALLIAVAFFVLKIVDVRWLRWRARTGLLTFAVVAIIAHARAGETNSALAGELPNAVAVAAITHAVSRAIPALPKVLRNMGGCRAKFIVPLHGMTHVAWALGRQHAAEIVFAHPRGPPMIRRSST